MKRIIDVFISILGLTILSPLFLLLSIFVKISSRGPVFFIQKKEENKRSNFHYWTLEKRDNFTT